MPKRLYILRHAKAESAQFNKEDHERCLTQRGLNDASHLGEYLRAEAMLPEHVLCSPATRTQETLEQLALKNIPITLHKGIYMASVTRLLNVIAETPDTVSSLMLVGHNPGVHELARLLAKEGDTEALEELSLHYPTCTLSVFSIRAKKWEDIATSPSVLEALITADNITHAPVGHAA